MSPVAGDAAAMRDTVGWADVTVAEVHVEGHEGMMHQDKDAFDAKSLDFSHDGSANADDFVTDKGRPADEMCLSIMAKADEYMALGESMILWRTSCIVIVMYRWRSWKPSSPRPAHDDPKTIILYSNSHE